MYNFDARIKKLRAVIEKLPNKFKITFADGSAEIAEDITAAINLCIDRNAASVEEIGEARHTTLIDILQALIETEPTEARTEPGDKPI